MSNHPADFRVEILKARPQGIPTFELGPVPVGEIVDVTDFTDIDSISSVNRATERDLLSFKTGDMTIGFLNHTRLFDDIFSTFGQNDIWGLHIFRRGELQFYGVIYGVGSIQFNRFERTVELTIYGLTKLLDMMSAEIVNRGVGQPGHYQLNGAHGANSTTLNLTPAVTDLRSGDILHLTNQVVAEDVTIKQQTGATTVLIEAPTVNAYASGVPVTLTTPYYRYQTIAFLVQKLCEHAGVALAELKLSNTQFNRLAPTPVNISGLADLSKDGRRGLVQKGGVRVQSIAGDKTYSQATPDAAFVADGGGSNQAGWYDWSKYYVEGSDEPPVHLRDPGAAALGDPDGETAVGGMFFKHASGADFVTSPTKTVYSINVAPSPAQLSKNTSTDGTTWSGTSAVANLPAGASPSDASCGSPCVEYDPVRNIVICSWADFARTNCYLYYWDVANAAWVNMKPAGDTALTGYFGPVYCADLDLILCMKSTQGTLGPDFTICAFRGALKLWERPFPSVSLNRNPATNIRTFYPTRTIRSVGGRLYGICVTDGAVQIFNSGDQFQTYEISKVYNSPSLQHMVAARINGAYCFHAYNGNVPRGHAISAAFYAGVVDYADFAGVSIAEALKRLAILCNALFWVDDNLQAHFVARDYFDPGAVTEIGDLVLEESSQLVWDQVSRYAKVSGNGFEATAGDAGFASEGIDLEVPYLPNGACAQALADLYYSFYSAVRRYIEGSIVDFDGRIFQPLERVAYNGLRWLVYESDHNLTDDEVSLTLLEDR